MALKKRIEEQLLALKKRIGMLQRIDGELHMRIRWRRPADYRMMMPMRGITPLIFMIGFGSTGRVIWRRESQASLSIVGQDPLG